MTETKPTVHELFEPCEVAGLPLRNRFDYARRARGGVALIITEGTYVPHPAARPDPAVPRMFGQRSLQGWVNKMRDGRVGEIVEFTVEHRRPLW
jgi:2,4-dienoyl-CoA reductase-like NADH-dependent reductase (Old Yellow Enzyme family)